jgi:hypothetical protein
MEYSIAVTPRRSASNRQAIRGISVGTLSPLLYRVRQAGYTATLPRLLCRRSVAQQV